MNGQHGGMNSRAFSSTWEESAFQRGKTAHSGAYGTKPAWDESPKSRDKYYCQSKPTLLNCFSSHHYMIVLIFNHHDDEAIIDINGE
jgi:hypothetical protein